jgi:Tol biopolymer transport system component
VLVIKTIYGLAAGSAAMRSVGALAVALALCCTPAGVGAERSPAIYEIGSGGSPRRLVGGVGALGFALSKDGSKVAFFRGYHEGASVWVVNRNGTGERQLVAGEGADRILADFPLVWSPDGDAVAYTTLETGSCRPETCRDTRVVIADVRDGRTRESFAGEGLRWYAKGRRMVWVCDSEPDPYGERESICFTRAGERAVQQIEVGLVDRVAPAPDGIRIAFTGQGGSPLGVVNLRTRSVRVLVDPASSVDGAPTWSPDSRKIAYATAAGELFTIRTSGGRPRRVGRFANARSPAWSPGGGRIAFLRERLWTVHPDGKVARRITRERVSAAHCPISSSAAPSCGPAWSPGGRKLYYLGLR